MSCLRRSMRVIMGNPDKQTHLKDDLGTKEKLVRMADIIIIATPHKAYNKIKFPKNKKIVDTWGILEK